MTKPLWPAVATTAPTTATTAEQNVSRLSLFDTVLVKVAARCNLACSYCYFFFSEDQRWRQQPAQISLETASHLARNLSHLLSSQDQGFAVVLHGGEPLLLGAEKLNNILALLREVLPPSRVSISLQTNGALITDAILDICSRHRVTLSVSIDGPRAAHDRFRLTHGGHSTFDATVAGISLLRGHPDAAFLFSGTLTVIEPTTNPEEIYTFLKSLGSPKLDFLYRDGNYDRLPIGKLSFDTTEFGDWLVRLWDFYVRDSSPVQIRILDDLAKLILGAKAQKEGVGLEPYSIVIVDTDGTIAKNDTLKNSFSGADTFDSPWNIRKDQLADVARTAEYRRYLDLQFADSEVCQSCRYLSVCGGGMPLYRWQEETGYQNPSVYCRDHQRVIDHVFSSLSTHLKHR